MNFSDQSRVWIYLSDQEFTDTQVSELNNLLGSFCIQWAAHGKNLKAKGDVLHHRFIILMVDETMAGASGCSIDESVHFIQQLEKDFSVQLFNRMLFAWRSGEEIRVAHLKNLQQLVEDGLISSDTIVFDTVITSKKDFDARFEIPFMKSWMRSRIKFPEVKT